MEKTFFCLVPIESILMFDFLLGRSKTHNFNSIKLQSVLFLSYNYMFPFKVNLMLFFMLRVHRHINLLGHT